MWWLLLYHMPEMCLGYPWCLQPSARHKKAVILDIEKGYYSPLSIHLASSTLFAHFQGTFHPHQYDPFITASYCVTLSPCKTLSYTMKNGCAESVQKVYDRWGVQKVGKTTSNAHFSHISPMALFLHTLCPLFVHLRQSDTSISSPPIRMSFCNSQPLCCSII